MYRPPVLSKTSPLTHTTSIHEAPATPARFGRIHSPANFTATPATPRICGRLDNLRPRVLNSLPAAGSKRKLACQSRALDTPTLVCRVPLDTPTKHARYHDESSLILLDELEDSRNVDLEISNARHSSSNARHSSSESRYSRNSRASTTRKNVSKCLYTTLLISN